MCAVRACVHQSVNDARVNTPCTAILTCVLLGPALCAAAAVGNLDELKRMQALGADINSGDYDARTVMPRHSTAS